MYQKNSSRTGFTMMELIVAAAIFSVFIISVLAFYRMGSQMFSGGSWKQQKQKDGELFLNYVKERITRASFPVDVKADGKFSEYPAKFGYASGTFAVANIPPGKGGLRLACFTVCKAKIKATPGVIMYHILRAVKDGDKAKSFDLEIVSTNNINMGKGAEFFTGSPFVFFTSTPDFTSFTGNPLDYDLGPATALHKITEITELKISGQEASDGTQLIFELNFTHPKLEKTQLYLTTSALIGKGLNVTQETTL